MVALNRLANSGSDVGAFLSRHHYDRRAMSHAEAAAPALRVTRQPSPEVSTESMRVEVEFWPDSGYGLELRTEPMHMHCTLCICGSTCHDSMKKNDTGQGLVYIEAPEEFKRHLSGAEALEIHGGATKFPRLRIYTRDFPLTTSRLRKSEFVKVPFALHELWWHACM